MSNKTVNALSKLKKLKKYDLDEKRQALIELQEKLHKLYQDVKELNQKQEDEIEAAREDHASRLNLPVYLEGLRIRQMLLKKQIYTLADFMIPIEESVKEAFKEVKALEFVIENLHDRAKKKQEKVEQEAIDELNLQRKSRIKND